MGLTRFPHGISSIAGPVIGDGARFSSPWNTHYFVDGTNGSDGNSGTEPTKAFKTIAKAVAASTGGDVIYIRPLSYKMGTGFNRYTEDVVMLNTGASSGVTAPLAGKSIIGITPSGVASDFMGVRWTQSSTVPLNIEAPGTHVENIGFFCEAATYGVYFEGDGATYTKAGHTGSSLYNCAIKGEGGVFANGSDSLQIINCQFQAKYNGTTSGIIITLDGSNVNRRPVVRGCHFLGGNGTAMASAPIIWTGKVENGLIADNYFDLGTTVQINIATSGSSGLIINNYFGEANLSSTFIVQNGMVCVANYDVTGLAAGV
jgi:hypothetical protein